MGCEVRPTNLRQSTRMQPIRLTYAKPYLAERFEAVGEIEERPRYNIAPTQQVVTVGKRRRKENPQVHNHALGPDSVLGKRREHRNPDAECSVGDRTLRIHSRRQRSKSLQTRRSFLPDPMRRCAIPCTRVRCCTLWAHRWRLGSYWGLVALAFMMAFLIWRLVEEEKFLAKNLSGYVEFQEKVQHRLVPYVW